MEDILHFISVHGYVGIFWLLMLGIVGLPLPDELVLTFAGYMVFKGHLQPSPTVMAAFLGSMCGITVSYLLGRTVGFRLLEKYGYLIHLNMDLIQQVQDWFQRLGKWLLLFGYFIAGVRHVTALVAGTSRLPLPVFALFAYTGALLWSITFITVGYFIGEELPKVYERLHHLRVIGSGIIIVLIISYWLIRRIKGRQPHLKE
jgi:membrane protein DedA with SNARE-associated domain